MPDIVVRGAGIFGLSIAWTCLCRGARVTVVDPFGAGSGSSGGLVGALAPHVPEAWNAKKAFQFDSLMMARPFWAAVEAAGGVSAGYGRTGRLQPVADAAALDLARARAAGAETLWQGKAVWQVVPADTQGAWCPASPTGFVIHDTLSARLHPRRAVSALVAALGARGVEVVAEAPDPPAGGTTVWATGAAGLADLSRALGRPVGAAVKGQAALLRLRAPEDAPQLFVDGLHLIPHADGTLAVGSTSERDFDTASGTDGRLADLVETARAAVPLLHGAKVIGRWAGLRPRARSRAPMLGPWPGRAGHVIANGGFKIGFGMAPNVARVIADLVLDGRDTIPDAFRVEASL